jgi:transposase
MNTLPIEWEGEMGNWRRRSREYKQQAVERMKASGNIQELARELGVERSLLYRWKWQFEGRPAKRDASYAGHAAPDTIETRLRRENKDLKEALGEKAAEVNFFAAALRRVKEDRRSKGGTSDPASTPKSRRRPGRRAD